MTLESRVMKRGLQLAAGGLMAAAANTASAGYYELPLTPELGAAVCDSIRFDNPVVDNAFRAACGGEAWEFTMPSGIPFFIKGRTVTIPVPPVSTPPIPSGTIGTPAINVPKTCALNLACFGPINIDENEYGTTPPLGPIPVTPEMRVTISVSDMEGEIDPTTDHYTIPPLVVNVPNPFGPPIPVELCPSGCAVPIGASAGDIEPTTVGFEIQVGNTVISQEVIADQRTDHMDLDLGFVQVGN